MRALHCLLPILIATGTLGILPVAAEAYYEEPCSPIFLTRNCMDPDLADTAACSGPAAATTAETRSAKIDWLLGYAAKALDHVDPQARLHAARLAACRLLELEAWEPARTVMREAQSSTVVTSVAHGSGGAYLEPFVRLSVLQGQVGFEADLETSMAQFEGLATAYPSLWNTLYARTFAMVGFTRIDRPEIAEAQFDRALELALQFPEVDAGRAIRQDILMVVARAVGDAGMWHKAEPVLQHLTAGQAILARLPSTPDNERTRLDTATLLDALKRRELPTSQ